MVKKTLQTVSASQACRQRMVDAKNQLPATVGQQEVIEFITEQAPHLNKLSNISRWKNAWTARVADPEITELVEKAALHFKKSRRASVQNRQKIVVPA